MRRPLRRQFDVPIAFERHANHAGAIADAEPIEKRPACLDDRVLGAADDRRLVDDDQDSAHRLGGELPAGSRGAQAARRVCGGAGPAADAPVVQDLARRAVNGDADVLRIERVDATPVFAECDDLDPGLRGACLGGRRLPCGVAQGRQRQEDRGGHQRGGS